MSIFCKTFDVRLYDRRKSLLQNQDIFTVVQPDLSVICNPDILDSQGCNGAPNWIIEILSKGNAKREMQIKYQLYQESGVQDIGWFTLTFWRYINLYWTKMVAMSLKTCLRMMTWRLGIYFLN